MADLSGYTPIYIRSNGNDTTGDGSSSSPYLTAQKAFEIAYNGTGNKVLDFGVGNFGGVNLSNVEWPNRIAVRGAGSTVSFLGGINGDGQDLVYDWDIGEIVLPPLPGLSISIFSDQSINLGDISSIGGEGGIVGAASGGIISLTDSVCENIISEGGYSGAEPAGNGGSISLTNSSSANISSNGGGDSIGGNGGNISLTNSSSATISSNCGSGYNAVFGGNISLTNSSSDNISNNGTGGDTGWDGASIFLINSSSNDISNSGGSVSLISSSSNDIISGGAISLNKSTSNNITCTNTTVSLTDSSSNTISSINGNTYLIGSSTIPNTIIASSVIATNLNKGRGVNGSSILGIV